MDLMLSIAFGLLVGFALGLTGGGGGIFAVPLLVYGLALTPREAVGVSLASVGAIALLGVAPRIARGDVDLRVGAVFAVAGVLGAPVGTLISGAVSEQTLLLMFSGLMLTIAGMMWRKSQRPETQLELPDVTTRTACRRAQDGELRLSSLCAAMLAAVGFSTGVLSGMFGVGGGFVIVPALVLLSGMPIQKAVATSLMVIVLVSLSGVGSYLWSGGRLELGIAALFLVGGAVGIQLGGVVMRRLPPRRLQQVFAVIVMGVAAFVVARSMT